MQRIRATQIGIAAVKRFRQGSDRTGLFSLSFPPDASNGTCGRGVCAGQITAPLLAPLLLVLHLLNPLPHLAHRRSFLLALRLPPGFHDPSG